MNNTNQSKSFFILIKISLIVTLLLYYIYILYYNQASYFKARLSTVLRSQHEKYDANVLSPVKKDYHISCMKVRAATKTKGFVIL